jgi:V/A-type H+-transporting ATPase subunit I
MKKVSVFVMDKDKIASLEKIRDLGLLHIEKRDVPAEKLASLLDRKAKLEQAGGVLLSFAPKKPVADAAVSVPEDIPAFVISLFEKRKNLQDMISTNARELGRIEKWGDFNPAAFKELGENGSPLYLYELTPKSFAEIGEQSVIVVYRDKKVIRCVSVGAPLEGETAFSLPERSLGELQAETANGLREIAGIEKTLAISAPLLANINEESGALSQKIEFETARCGMETIDDAAGALSVCSITGFIPDEDLGVLKRGAAENGWALYADEPDEEDPVPTKLKNNRLVSLIYPLTGFLETLPGYREVDISGWFLFFFCIFFGMIFGDAGYGLLLLLGALIGILKTQKTGVPAAFKMLLLLSITNTLWGVLTCSWFGMNISVVPQILQNISLPLISTSTGGHNLWTLVGLATAKTGEAAQKAYVDENLRLFCFSLALAQLSVAHIKGIIRNIRSLKLFADLGQLLMLCGMYGVILYLVVSSKRFPFLETNLNLILGLIGSGFGLSFIFAYYDGSIVKSIVESLKNIISVVLGVTNVFSDIMSYIRLWAVGLAGASISATVNTMAGPLLGNFLLFLGVILLVFGHGLNMVMNVLSVLVHGVRLNTLEFSSHVGLGWSGIAYKPFANKTVKK